MTNERIAVRAHWDKYKVKWGHVIQDYYSPDADWMKKYGGLTPKNFVFKPDNDGHSRLVDYTDIIS